MQLADKTAVVSGGGSGIGLGVPRALAAAGCRTQIAGRSEPRLQRAAAACQQSPPMLLHTVDVADRQSVQRLFEWAAGRLGRVDILVNSAGASKSSKRTGNATR